MGVGVLWVEDYIVGGVVFDYVFLVEDYDFVVEVLSGC